MVITSIKPQKNSDRVNIYLDGQFAFGLMTEIQYKHDLYEGMDVTREFIDKILLEEEQKSANNVGLKFLSHRKRSKKEIVDKLESKGFEKDIIENTIIYLKRYGLIDDLDYARSFIKDRISLNKHGQYRIKHDLSKRGISKDIIETILDDDDEYPRALELAKKKLSSYKDDDRDKIYRKLGGFLQGRGYSYDCIMKVLNTLMDER